MKKSILLFYITIIFSLITISCTSQNELKKITLFQDTPYKGITAIEQNTSIPQSSDENKIYTFSFDRRLQPKDDLMMYIPLLNYLEKETGFYFSILIPERGERVADLLAEGKVDFAAVGALSYIQAKQKGVGEILVKGNNDKGGYYKSVIITRKNSSLSSIKQLKGHSFAFGAETSTQGYLIPKIMLRKEGIQLSDFQKYVFLNSHAEVANVILNGDYEAGAIQDTLAYSLAAKGLVKILAESDDYPTSGIIVNSNILSEDAKKVQEALIKFDPAGKNQEGLYNWSLSEMPLGFIEASEEEYAFIEQEYLNDTRR